MTTPNATLLTGTAPATLTPETALQNARDLRQRLVDESAETEARTFHSEGLHLAFVEAGFYNLLRPAMFGGYEFSVPDFLRVMREVARGDMATAWSLTLASGHNLQFASWWPEQTQREIFQPGRHFAAAMTAVPGGIIERTPPGWLLNSRHPYASGGAYSTHYIGQAMTADRPGEMSLFIAPRESWSVADDWGRTMGLRGSGSHSLLFENVTLPEHYVLEGRNQVLYDVSEGTPGLRLHGNPIYAGRALGFFGIELATLSVGAVRGALDEYEALMQSKRMPLPPFATRAEDSRYASWFADAYARLIAADAVVDRAADLYQAACERTAAGGRPFDAEDDSLINLVAQQGQRIAWKVMHDVIFKTAGSSAATTGLRLERLWRDVSMAWGHVNTILYDHTAESFTRAHFGLDAARSDD